jgi:hypothetical protein
MARFGLKLIYSPELYTSSHTGLDLVLTFPILRLKHNSEKSFTSAALEMN